MKFNKPIKRLLRLFFPEACVACGDELLEEEIGICLNCMYKLPKTNNYKIIDNQVEQFMAGRIPFERIASYCIYSKGGILQPLIHNLKYYNRSDIGTLLGRLFAADLVDSEFLAPIDLIVPVPLHPKRLRSRGYNQSEIIAKGISDKTLIPLSTGNLIRLIYNPTQTKMLKNQRWENVKNIFEVKDITQFENKHILLVDDVITTGSTIEACGVALQRCDSLKLSIATIGQVI